MVPKSETPCESHTIDMRLPEVEPCDSYGGGASITFILQICYCRSILLFLVISVDCNLT